MCRSDEKVQVLQVQQLARAGLLGEKAIFGICCAARAGMARVSNLLMLLGLLVLAGCAGRPVADPEPRVVRVEVPVPVPCRVTIPMAPAWASAGLRKSDDLETKVRALVAEREQRIGFEALLLAAAKSCE